VRAVEARHWGWHRLDRAWASRIVGAAGVQAGDLVLDVGAGDGSLTEALVRAGASVVAVELHRGRAESLRRRFSGQPVRVLTVDATDLRLPLRRFKVVANPPFAIAMAVLNRLVAPGSRLGAADVVVPRHIARRWCSHVVAGSGRWSEQFDVSLGLRLPARSFSPAAPRDAVVLRMRRIERPGRGSGSTRPATAGWYPPDG
jgi:23S rRNA (adenine-N6)-dimethyltransferase